MSSHTRKPYKLDYKSYLTWMREFAKWLLAHVGDADYPLHIVPSVAAFSALIDTFQAVLGPYDNLIQLAKAKNKLYKTAFENIYDKLKQIKWALPTIADDPDILALFNLAGELPDDRDDMFITAQNALNYWATVAADPLFAPMVADFSALQVLFDDFVAAREAYFNTDNERETKQNELLAAKEALDTTEREAFTWYRSRHTDGNDEWWTGTEWGTVSEGSGGAPATNPFPNPLTGLNAVVNELGHISVKADAQSGAVAYNFYAVETMPGQPIPEKPPEAEWKLISIPSIMDTKHQPGTVKTYWACGIDAGGVEGEFCAPVSVAIME